MKNKKDGFTLIELLIVVTLVAVISAGSAIVFEQSTASTYESDLENTYKQIQRAATLYMDLNDSWIATFQEDKEATIRVSELKNTNYISSKLKNPVTKEDIPNNYLIKIYLESQDSKEYLNTCIIEYSGSTLKCISNNEGKACQCCNFPVDAVNNPAC